MEKKKVLKLVKIAAFVVNRIVIEIKEKAETLISD